MYIKRLAQCFFTEVWKEHSNVISAGARSPTVLPAGHLTCWELQIYVCGFISPADLENNSLKHPLNEGQVSRSVRRQTTLSSPVRVRGLPGYQGSCPVSWR